MRVCVCVSIGMCARVCDECAHVRTHVCVCVCVRTESHMCVRVCALMHTRTHVSTRLQACVGVRACTQARTHARARMYVLSCYVAYPMLSFGAAM